MSQLIGTNRPGCSSNWHKFPELPPTNNKSHVCISNEMKWQILLPLHQKLLECDSHHSQWTSQTTQSNSFAIQYEDNNHGTFKKT